MRAVLYTYDTAWTVEGESYKVVKDRYENALRQDQPTFEFQARTLAFRGATPVVIPTSSIIRIEAT